MLAKCSAGWTTVGIRVYQALLWLLYIHFLHTAPSDKDGPHGWDLPRLPSEGRLQSRNEPHLPLGEVRLLGQALAHGRKKETITMMSERESGSETRRTKGREREGDHNVVSSLELRDAATGLFCFSTLGWQMTSGLTCDILSWEMKKSKSEFGLFLCNPGWRMSYLQYGPAAGSVRTQPEVPAMWSMASPAVVFTLRGVLPWNARPLASAWANSLERPRLLESERT